MLPVSSCPTAVVVGWLWFLAPSGMVSLEAGETSGASLAAKARAQEENSLSARVLCSSNTLAIGPCRSSKITFAAVTPG
jgi:hypothetical protein